MTTRASIFEPEPPQPKGPSTPPDDLSDFSPRPKSPIPQEERQQIREIAEQRGFSSREPSNGTPASVDQLPGENTITRRRPHRTGRSKQLNIKITAAAMQRFYDICDTHELVLGEGFDRALTAWEEKLSKGGI